MARYRTRPVEVDAVQWTGDNRRELEDFVGNTVTVQPDGKAMFWASIGSIWVPTGTWVTKATAEPDRTYFGLIADDQFKTGYEPLP